MSDHPELSVEERYVIRHALGMGPVNAAKVAYRNHWCGENIDFEKLVERGLAIKWFPRVDSPEEGKPRYSKRPYYAAKLAAALAALENGEGIDREELAKMKAWEEATNAR